ncbi:flagellar export chaperone FliS [Paenibacillus sp. CAU 1523]|uniref:Flagellar secretion chaperone FliS n=2 Tax=Paenibacillus arenosi TaxID=2774142 RepID=A0ABR9AYH9_9BACL|nr:flagellar export chaperone FliS [Paenibacillus arenosi]
MYNVKQEQYLKVKVETASPGELTLMLYQEMVKSLLKAKQLYAQHQFEEMNRSIYKVRDIINELTITLNMDHTIARELYDLYMFYQRHLTEFIIKRDEQMLDDVLEFSKEMVDTWKQALLIVRKGGQHVSV